MVKKTFKRDYLEDELDLPWGAIEDNIVDQGRWTTQHEIVFKDNDGKYYMTTYERGLLS